MADRGNIHSAVELLLRTPLAVLFQGGTAVFVFFILSGIVLTLPYIERSPRALDWFVYYPKRLIRLYLPVFGSVLLTALLIFAVPRTFDARTTWWVNGHPETLTTKDLYLDATQLFGCTCANSVLWTLHWEIVFSLLLPLYIYVARLFHRFWLFGVFCMVAASWAGEWLGIEQLRFLPMFGIGVFVALGLRKVERWSRRARGKLGTVFAVSSVTIFAVVWAWPEVPGETPLILIACTATVLAFSISPGLNRLSQWPVVAWLASRSFSLYLVHEPILIAAITLTGEPMLATVIAWPIALLITEGFFRVVEEPSRKLAGTTGQLVKNTVSRIDSRILVAKQRSLDNVTDNRL